MINTFLPVFNNLDSDRCIVCIYIFLCNPFLIIVFSSIGKCILQYLWNFPLSDIFWTSTCLIVYTVAVNQRLSHFSKIHKIIIRLEEIFHHQISNHFSTRYKKIKNSDGTTGCSLCTLQTNLGLSTSIITQVIVVLHSPPAYVMISNHFKIIEIDYLPIHHPSLFLLNLWHSLS